MRNIRLFAVLFILSSVLYGQEQQSFYATMALHQAYALQNQLPHQTQIIDTEGNEAAVYLSWEAAELLQDKILVHGPGFIYQNSLEDAVNALNTSAVRQRDLRIAFNITEDAVVNQVLDLIDVQYIADHIVELENYGTRYHDRAQAQESAADLKVKWEAMAAQYDRNDVSVRLYNHVSTPMPSVIMTIEGTELPDEYVVVGGHLDSTSNQGNNDAPGADDDASGIATITEAVRALFEAGFVPTRTVEIMAYAAEEIGLVGSNEIAQEYSSDGINVIAYVQFDMTNYQGSGQDVYFITDYTAASLNSHLMALMDHYNSSGDHAFSYGTTLCNYGCSDHASWHNQGFLAAFPFESSFGQHNPNIHTSSDTFDFVGTADHAVKFAKLCAEFIVETAKNDDLLGVDETALYEYQVYTDRSRLHYRFEGPDTPEYVEIFDMVGNLVLTKRITEAEGVLLLDRLPTGVYLSRFTMPGSRQLTDKILIH